MKVMPVKNKCWNTFKIKPPPRYGKVNLVVNNAS